MAECGDYRLPVVRKALQQVLTPLGGAGRIIPKGARVLIKPNLLQDAPPEKAATTHPALVEAVIELVIDSGALPMIGDSPPFSTRCANIKKTGIGEVVKRFGLEIIDFEPSIIYQNNENRIYKRIEASHLIKEADLIINMPKMKTHCQMLLTLGVKNLFGLITGLKKPQWHLKAGIDRALFADMLLDLYCIVKPGLTILDAVTIMEGNGPGSGTPRHGGFIASAFDPLPLDHVICQIAGVEPARYPVLDAAQKRNLYNPLFIDVAGEGISRFAMTDFKLPELTKNALFGPGTIASKARQVLTQRPVINDKACQRCGQCERMCPVNAITLPGSKLKKSRINYKTCIRCYCCHEICKYHAISIKRWGIAQWF